MLQHTMVFCVFSLPLVTLVTFDCLRLIPCLQYDFPLRPDTPVKLSVWVPMTQGTGMLACQQMTSEQAVSDLECAVNSVLIVPDLCRGRGWHVFSFEVHFCICSLFYIKFHLISNLMAKAEVMLTFFCVCVYI